MSLIYLVSPKLPRVIHDAAIDAEVFLKTGLSVILGKSEFTHTSERPELVFNHIVSMVHEFDEKNFISLGDEKIAFSKPRLVVEPWKPMNLWTSAIATTFKNKPGVIFINVRKINSRKSSDYTNTLVHEFCHTPCGYSHGSNSPKGKQNSVPYWLGAQAENYVNDYTLKTQLGMA